MIPHGHVHTFSPFSTFARPDGRREIGSRCQCGEGTVIEQKLVVNPDGSPHRLQFRIGMLWFEPLDLVRLGLPVEECAACHGKPPAVQGLPPCPLCNGLGVTAGGHRVEAPELTTV